MFNQPTRQITFNLNYSQPINFELLDEWLISVLKIEIDEDDDSQVPIEWLIK
jgi:hypothetical protein